MSGFTFGLSGAAVSSAPATSSLFGTVQKPLFGTPTTTQPTANAGLFGTSTSLATTSTTSALFGVSVPSTGFFGSPAKTTGSLLGFAATTTTATGGFFGSLPATSASGLFGSTPSVSTSGSLFGSPAPGFFSTPAVSTTTLSGGLFGASENSAYTVGKGLGGIGTLTTVGSAANGSIGVAGAAASGNPMEAEVSQVVMGLFNLLRNQIKRNHELSEEFAMYSSDSCLEMDEKIKGLGAIRVKRADLMRSAQTKANELLGKIQRDVRAAEQVRRRQRETSKNPQFGRKQALSYLVGICVEHEDIVREFVTTLNLLEERVIAKLNKCDLTSKEDLQKHFEHYDQSFKVICSDIYRCKIQVEDLRDTFLEYRRRVIPYSPNPFERDRTKHSERSNLGMRFTGAEAFPSQVTMMKIGEMAKSSSASPVTSGVSGFNPSGSLFGSKTFGAPTFSFNTSNANKTPSLFKPFSTTNTSPALFGSSTTSVAGPLPAPTAPSSFTFGNTLNSSVSGTLFGGSASKLFGR